MEPSDEAWPHIHLQPARTDVPETGLSSWGMHWPPLSKDGSNDADEIGRPLTTSLKASLLVNVDITSAII